MKRLLGILCLVQFVFVITSQEASSDIFDPLSKEIDSPLYPHVIKEFENIQFEGVIFPSEYDDTEFKEHKEELEELKIKKEFIQYLINEKEFLCEMLKINPYLTRHRMPLYTLVFHKKEVLFLHEKALKMHQKTTGLF